MKTKHTQGEWKSENLLGFPRMGNFPKVVSGDGSLIAELGGGELDEVEANTKLIAAAPDLLKACIRALKEIQNPKRDGTLAEEDLINAIKKATEG